VTDARRALPSVSSLLEVPDIQQLANIAPRAVVVDALREALDAVRAGAAVPSSDAEWARRVAAGVARAQRASLRPVLNGTGVVLHTNLGRAALADAAVRAVRTVAGGFSNLEYDLDGGGRGSRHAHCVALLRELTGAEDALVVNNGAAAVLLALNTIADGRDVIVSRGELVEIGGGFRVPDVMVKSGARLVEVGTTNRTHPDDYVRAIGAGTAAIVKVHRSNFAIEGFVADVGVAELAGLVSTRGIPILHDLGSGLLISLAAIGLTGEPTARDAIAAGASIVTMSGDKLLGGHQAGLIVGSAPLIARLRDNPLTRALRVDKLTLAALEATLALYRDPARALREIPVLAMLGTVVEELRPRAEAIRARLRRDADVRIVDADAMVGGGAFPTARIRSVALSFGGDGAVFEARLRHGEPAVVGRVSDGRVLIDLRTILPREDDALTGAVSRALEP
jgi:L-seryl-tRNA(Ser) seleniumtransferase